MVNSTDPYCGTILLVKFSLFLISLKVLNIIEFTFYLWISVWLNCIACFRTFAIINDGVMIYSGSKYIMHVADFNRNYQEFTSMVIE